MADNERKPEGGDRNGASYGGFQYRWSYDEYIRSLRKKRNRPKAITKLRFAVTMSVIFFLCMVILLFVLLYSQYGGGGDEADDYGVGLPSIGIYAEGISEEDAYRFGLARGVLVKFSIYGASALMMGDIILAVDGVEMRTAGQLADALEENADAPVRLWRNGSVIELEAVK